MTCDCWLIIRWKVLLHDARGLRPSYQMSFLSHDQLFCGLSVPLAVCTCSVSPHTLTVSVLLCALTGSDCNNGGGICGIYPARAAATPCRYHRIEDIVTRPFSQFEFINVLGNVYCDLRRCRRTAAVFTRLCRHVWTAQRFIAVALLLPFRSLHTRKRLLANSPGFEPAPNLPINV